MIKWLLPLNKFNSAWMYSKTLTSISWQLRKVYDSTSIWHHSVLLSPESRLHGGVPLFKRCAERNNSMPEISRSLCLVKSRWLKVGWSYSYHIGQELQVIPGSYISMRWLIKNISDTPPIVVEILIKQLFNFSSVELTSKLYISTFKALLASFLVEYYTPDSSVFNDCPSSRIQQPPRVAHDGHQEFTSTHWIGYPLLTGI